MLDSAGPQPPLRYRWTGREWDAETGFYFHRTRYYDPAVGRFVQEDRAGYGGGGNLYAYVDGNVLQARDPDGMMAQFTWAGLCIGRICFGNGGELDPSNGGGPAGGGWSEMLGASILTQVERSAFYRLYLKNYKVLRKRFADDPDLGKYLTTARAMNPTEFAKALDAIASRLMRAPGDIATMVGDLVAARLRLGEIFMNQTWFMSNFHEPGRTALGYTPKNAQITMLNEQLFYYDLGQIANTLVHETIHAYWDAMYPWDTAECAVSARANQISRYVPAGGLPPGCN